MSWAKSQSALDDPISSLFPEGESRRLLSLLAIMDIFDVHSLAYVMHEISQNELCFLMLKLSGQGSARPAGEALARAKRGLEFADNFFHIYNIGKCEDHVQTAKKQWDRPTLDASAAVEIFHRLQFDLISELKSKIFLRVAEDRGEFVDKDSLFGEKVKIAFASSSRDIKEAGNCLAAECNTAAVFHLMRAAEVSLRAIAMDRQVSFANKPIDQQEWGTILGALEGKLKDMRLADGKKWKDPSFKEAQIHFYNDAVQELRGFNETWRRHISHADPKAFYERDDAIGILKHVRKFMQKLSTRISENAVMLEFWETE